MFKYAVGLMSGTSLDGIDAALVKIKGSGENTEVELIEFVNLDMPDSIKKEIKSCCRIEESNVELICSLNFKLGYIFADAVKEVCKRANFPIHKLDFIGSHGQTVYHIPTDKAESIKSTLQIGEPAVISYETGTTVVSNFRVMDMAAGGQGAPLVPYVDYILFKGDRNRALQNIGGIGNVTVIPKNCTVDDILAFDTGPGNMIIDEVVQRLKGVKYDKDGYLASQGRIIENMLRELLDIPYIQKKPPKTTGRELFGSQFVDELLTKWKNKRDVDIIATVTAFTAYSIYENYKRFIFDKYDIDEVIISGGGSYNKTLISMIKNLLPNCKVFILEDLGFSSDAKEAIAFAILANETLNGICSNVRGATGAKQRVVLGNITPSKKFFRGNNI
ncbi:anhydro-N-acetylmuramic acid kinase AnmK [Caloramator proteoclasticus]|uniref:Anhydro-N-acetylmuramic acid kinase n=1 Tax=Caloramator proteoclasticus DSM 10124 TaxID=1121262 RepID=A0A1M4T2H0_9CLOT|nr:anhydro-N-acetylmuramic acid kinase AnmK [Caloramator proteoclasticus]SHE38605.1 anhydro-N-acetylmuramic acid kinase [Caloramator proteoclasticus DSM 10124]